MRIDVVDYGVGNLASVCKALEFIGASPSRVPGAASIADARAIIIPGVGHFAATRALNEDWRDAIIAAISRGVPVLGICLGMQWLFEGSAEAPDVSGLGAMAGMCSTLSGNVKVPHVGWNTLERTRTSVLLAGIAEGAAAYFTHSYAAPVTDGAVSTTTHGQAFASAVERDRVFGVQWHPEKSGAVGLTLLANFVAFAKEASC